MTNKSWRAVKLINFNFLHSFIISFILFSFSSFLHFANAFFLSFFLSFFLYLFIYLFLSTIVFSFSFLFIIIKTNSSFHLLDTTDMEVSGCVTGVRKKRILLRDSTYQRGTDYFFSFFFFFSNTHSFPEDNLIPMKLKLSVANLF